MNKTNWKDYINTALLGIVCYLLVDMHKSFKTLVTDVELLKEQVHLHEYILNNDNREKRNREKNNKISEAVLPTDTRIKKNDDKTKHSDS